MPPFVAPALVLLFVGLVLAAALKDALSFTIPNWVSLALIAAGISLAIIAAVNGLGTTLNTKFTNIGSSIK